MISDSQFSSSLFHEIKSFRVVGHGAKSIDFRISFLERFYTLENLAISYCEIKELFCTEGDTSNKETYAGTLSTIRNLKLVALDNLKDYLWKQDFQVDYILPKLETLEVHECHNMISLGSSSTSFQNLTTLYMWNCKAMNYLDTCLAVKGTAQLKKLMVKDCISMKEIVATEGDEATCDIIFSRLKNLVILAYSIISFFLPYGLGWLRYNLMNFNPCFYWCFGELNSKVDQKACAASLVAWRRNKSSAPWFKEKSNKNKKCKA
ncbi:hypothetical protein J1N35_023326 [Gossypium stocksii]|uniref:Disease resistance protein At4g27190-like leucine-rich repeats domain-containing protein n=1 Tax=Gossypium stocksii TaxID=47602 RepID=A0A9D3VHZ0_9ROSI|nr:hypothetical protein J1N35_023326 [Gossypium stocksii]